MNRGGRSWRLDVLDGKIQEAMSKGVGGCEPRKFLKFFLADCQRDRHLRWLLSSEVSGLPDSSS